MSLISKSDRVLANHRRSMVLDLRLLEKRDVGAELYFPQNHFPS